MRWLPWGLVLASLALPVLTPAAPKQNEPAGEVMYRYTKPDGTLAVSATLNEQAIHAGYQVLDHNGRVLRREPPAPPEEQARRLHVLHQRQNRRAVRVVHVSPQLVVILLRDPAETPVASASALAHRRTFSPR